MIHEPRVLGHVISVSGFRVRVELTAELRASSRATLDGVQKAVAINAYVIFAIGAGTYVFGVVTDLDARESYDPTSDEELSLQLTKQRRVAAIQLLGTIERRDNQWAFDPGITILPTLDTAAEISSPDILKAVFETPPRRNRPTETKLEGFDSELDIGCPTGQRYSRVKASFNDMFSRPVAVVGNTGSGKSYTAAGLIQKAMAAIGRNSAKGPHIFILDINGEYGRAFYVDQTPREPDHIYVNGREFGIPVWLMNAQEVCSWLSAAEQTQEPVLKDWWAIAKEGTDGAPSKAASSLRYALIKIDDLLSTLDETKGPRKQKVCLLFNIAEAYWHKAGLSLGTTLKGLVAPHRGSTDWLPLGNEVELSEAAQAVQEQLRSEISALTVGEGRVGSTADTPLFIPRGALTDPALVDAAVTQEDAGRIEAHLTTLKLRLRTRLDDKRWSSFLNYESLKKPIKNLTDWLQQLGIGMSEATKVSIIDLSMLGNEVLPYACAVIGRTLLESRERLPADQRFQTPWVLVLEEAHNYARPARQVEDRGQALSRDAFERIAKEGRKFGLSLIVASQRPSEISPTIISQCANFISHRLQNPDDIEHFRKIIPLQARRLLDQVTVLASGEAIVFGSAFHVPSRVQLDRPQPTPWSQTSAPYYEWKKEDAQFPVETVTSNWGLKTE